VDIDSVGTAWWGTILKNQTLSEGLKFRTLCCLRNSDFNLSSFSFFTLFWIGFYVSIESCEYSFLKPYFSYSFFHRRYDLNLSIWLRLLSYMSVISHFVGFKFVWLGLWSATRQHDSSIEISAIRASSTREPVHRLRVFNFTGNFFLSQPGRVYNAKTINFFVHNLFLFLFVRLLIIHLHDDLYII